METAKEPSYAAFASRIGTEKHVQWIDGMTSSDAAYKYYANNICWLMRVADLDTSYVPRPEVSGDDYSNFVNDQVYSSAVSDERAFLDTWNTHVLSIIKQLNLQANCAQSGGGRSYTNTSSTKWELTKRKVTVGSVVRAVYRSSKTGELRVKRMDKRTGKAKYVKF
jgi:hypothetical protein